MSVGTLYAGYGVSENLTVAVSPFLYTNYGMHNLFGRWTTRVGTDKNVMFDLGYYKSFTSQYVMEAVSFKSGLSTNTGQYRLNVAVSGYYYFESERPFSLRMVPYNSDKYALILSSLHEFALTRRVFLNLELGALGLNYTYPYLQTGGSFAYQGDSFYAGVGASYTVARQIPEDRTLYTGSLGQTWKNSSLHPEVQIQFFF